MLHKCFLPVLALAFCSFALVNVSSWSVASYTISPGDFTAASVKVTATKSVNLAVSVVVLNGDQINRITAPMVWLLTGAQTTYVTTKSFTPSITSGSITYQLEICAIDPVTNAADYEYKNFTVTVELPCDGYISFTSALANATEVTIPWDVNVANVQITWGTRTNGDHYCGCAADDYSISDNGTTVTSGISSTSYNINLTPGVHTIIIKAYPNPDCISTSTISKTVTVTVIQTPKPEVPQVTSISSSTSGQTVTISWAGNSTTAGYEIWGGDLDQPISTMFASHSFTSDWSSSGVFHVTPITSGGTKGSESTVQWSVGANPVTPPLVYTGITTMKMSTTSYSFTVLATGYNLSYLHAIMSGTTVVKSSGPVISNVFSVSGLEEMKSYRYTVTIADSKGASITKEVLFSTSTDVTLFDLNSLELEDSDLLAVGYNDDGSIAVVGIFKDAQNASSDFVWGAMTAECGSNTTGWCTTGEVVTGLSEWFGAGIGCIIGLAAAGVGCIPGAVVGFAFGSIISTGTAISQTSYQGSNLVYEGAQFYSVDGTVTDAQLNVRMTNTAWAGVGLLPIAGDLKNAKFVLRGKPSNLMKVLGLSDEMAATVERIMLKYFPDGKYSVELTTLMAKTAAKGAKYLNEAEYLTASLRALKNNDGIIKNATMFNWDKAPFAKMLGNLNMEKLIPADNAEKLIEEIVTYSSKAAPTGADREMVSLLRTKLMAETVFKNSANVGSFTDVTANYHHVQEIVDGVPRDFGDVVYDVTVNGVTSRHFWQVKSNWADNIVEEIEASRLLAVRYGYSPANVYGFVAGKLENSVMNNVFYKRSARMSVVGTYVLLPDSLVGMVDSSGDARAVPLIELDSMLVLDVGTGNIICKWVDAGLVSAGLKYRTGKSAISSVIVYDLRGRKLGMRNYKMSNVPTGVFFIKADRSVVKTGVVVR